MSEELDQAEGKLDNDNNKVLKDISNPLVPSWRDYERFLS